MVVTFAFDPNWIGYFVPFTREDYMKPDSTTIAVYDAKTEEYLKLGPLTGERKAEARFAQSLPQGGMVMDYGCGPGRTAGYFARQGLITHAFDASGEMVKLASAHDGVTAWQAGFDTFSAPDTYDGIWASFSLLHAARSDMPTFLDKINEALKTGGKFYIALKLGQGAARDALGRLYTYYQEGELRDLLANAGFTWQTHRIGSEVGLDGTMSKLISVLADA